MIKSAYMLFYDRVVPLKTDLIKSREEVKENDERISKTSQQTDNKIITVNPLEEFHLELIENNFKFHIHRNVFSQEFFKFITNVVMNREYTKNRDYLPFPMVYDASLEPKKHYDLELLKMGCIFLLTCVIREKERSNIIEFLPFITKQLKKVKRYNIQINYSY